MPFADCPEHRLAVRIFRKSLASDRMAHAWLLHGGEIASLERLAIAVAMALQCETPPERSPGGTGTDSCGSCPSCRRILGGRQADVTWLRPESKSRIILVEQIRQVLQTVHQKAYSSPYKVFILSGADRMNPQAANAFLKTLEEPPDRTVFLLLSTMPGRLLATIHSRCMRIRTGATASSPAEEDRDWLRDFHSPDRTPGPYQRYRILDRLLTRLEEKRTAIEKSLHQASPLAAMEDPEPAMRTRYTRELAAAIEAEYRRARAETLSSLHWFLRDVWLHTLGTAASLLHFPDLEQESRGIARRIPPRAARANLDIAGELQQNLDTNIQEVLALEVALLRLAL